MSEKMTASAARPMLTSKMMDDAWQQVVKEVVPPETHPDMVKTFKRFYYAGAKHLLDSFIYYADLAETDQPTPEDLSKIDAVLHEINEFFGEVAAGRQ